MTQYQLTLDSELLYPRIAQRDAHSAAGASPARSTLALFLARDQKDLCLVVATAGGRMLFRQSLDALQLAAAPGGGMLLAPCARVCVVLSPLFHHHQEWLGFPAYKSQPILPLRRNLFLYFPPDYPLPSQF